MKILPWGSIQVKILVWSPVFFSFGSPLSTTAFIQNYDFIPSFDETGAHYPSPVSGTLWITQQYFLGFKSQMCTSPTRNKQIAKVILWPSYWSNGWRFHHSQVTRPWSGSLNKRIPTSPALYLFKGVVVVPDLSWVYLPIIVHWWAKWVHSDGGWRCVLQIGLWMSLWLSSSRMHIVVRSKPVIAGESSSAWSLAWYDVVVVDTHR